MTIHLNAEQERVIGLAIQTGVIREAADAVDVGLETIRRQLETRLSSRTATDPDQWYKDLHAWVHGHARSTPLLSDEAISRDSVYGSRGF